MAPSELMKLQSSIFISTAARIIYRPKQGKYRLNTGQFLQNLQAKYRLIQADFKKNTGFFENKSLQGLKFIFNNSSIIYLNLSLNLKKQFLQKIFSNDRAWLLRSSSLLDVTKKIYRYFFTSPQFTGFCLDLQTFYGPDFTKRP